jgi:hypothetical protein
MPHRAKIAGLRPRTDSCASSNTTVVPAVVSEFRTMSSIAALKYGINDKLYRSKGWLHRLLMKEGMTRIKPKHQFSDDVLFAYSDRNFG